MPARMPKKIPVKPQKAKKFAHLQFARGTPLFRILVLRMNLESLRRDINLTQAALAEKMRDRNFPDAMEYRRDQLRLEDQTRRVCETLQRLVGGMGKSDMEGIFEEIGGRVGSLQARLHEIDANWPRLHEKKRLQKALAEKARIKTELAFLEKDERFLFGELKKKE